MRRVVSLELIVEIREFECEFPVSRAPIPAWDVRPSGRHERPLPDFRRYEIGRPLGVSFTDHSPELVSEKKTWPLKGCAPQTIVAFGV